MASPPPLPPVTMGIAKDGCPIVCLGNESEGERPYCLASQYQPMKEAERILEDKEGTEKKVEDWQIVFVLGAGNPNLLLLVLKKYPDIPLVIVENHPGIRNLVIAWLEENHPSLFNQSSKRLFWVDEEADDEEIRGWFKEHSVKQIKFFQNQKQLSLFPQFFSGIKDRVIKIHNQRSSNRSTFARFEKLWLRNITKNTEQIIKSYPLELCRKQGEGIPVVIVGAGPSLETELERLALVQERVIIISCDTTLKVLLHHNIRPDLTVVVDPQKINSKYLENIPPEELASTILISEPGVVNQGIRNFPYLIMFDSIFPYYQLLTKHFNFKGEIEIGGTVISAAYEVAKVFGFSPIAFLGMDFCFQEDKYHLRGSMYEEIFFSLLHRYQSFEMFHSQIINHDVTPTINHLGKQVYIDKKFMLFKTWLEKKFFQDQPKAVNSSEGGISIEGLPFKRFSDFIQDSPPVSTDRPSPKTELMKDLRLKIERYREIRTLANPEFVEVFSRFKQDCQQLLESIEEYRTILKKIIRHIQKRQIDKVLALQEEILNGEAARLAKPFVEIVIQKALYSITHGQGEGSGKTDGDNHESLKKLYQELFDGSELNLKYLNKISFAGEKIFSEIAK